VGTVFATNLAASGLGSKAGDLVGDFVNDINPNMWDKIASAASNVASSTTSAIVQGADAGTAAGEALLASAGEEFKSQIKSNTKTAEAKTELPSIEDILQAAYQDPTSKAEVAGLESAGGATLSRAVEQNVVKQIIQQANPSVLDDILRGSSSFLDEVVDATGKKLAPTLENILGDDDARKQLLEKIISKDPKLLGAYGTEAAQTLLRNAGVVLTLGTLSGNEFQNTNEDAIMAERNKEFTDSKLTKVEVTANREYLDESGIFRDSAGNALGDYVDADGNVRNKDGVATGDYVDDAGNLYDDAGNPVGKIESFSSTKTATTVLPETETKTATTVLPETETKTATTVLPETETKTATTVLPETETKTSTTVLP
jgi:vacuolar-type H+-ATPase subunit E/Vma4